jgi:hypothetical protein
LSLLFYCPAPAALPGDSGKPIRGIVNPQNCHISVPTDARNITAGAQANNAKNPARHYCSSCNPRTLANLTRQLHIKAWQSSLINDKSVIKPAF